MAAADVCISLQNVEKVYRTARLGQVHALSEINLDIRQGEFVSVLGPSGCGKSTLLKIIAGLLTRSSGRLLLYGTPIEGPRREMGIVFQDPVLLPWRTVLENALLPAEVLGLNMKESAARAHELIRLVGLKGFEDKYPMELSGGMRQRNAIIRALMHDPAVLLMDEPFGALDAMTREQMNLELQRIWLESKKTVFFITHSIPEAVFLADRVLVMTPRPGRITEEIRVDIERPRSLATMGEQDFVSLTQRIRGLFYTEGAIDL